MGNYQPKGKIRDVDICRVCKQIKSPKDLIIDRIDGNNFYLMKQYAENPICRDCLLTPPTE